MKNHDVLHMYSILYINNIYTNALYKLLGIGILVTYMITSHLVFQKMY